MGWYKDPCLSTSRESDPPHTQSMEDCHKERLSSDGDNCRWPVFHTSAPWEGHGGDLQGRDGPRVHDSTDDAFEFSALRDWCYTTPAGNPRPFQPGRGLGGRGGRGLPRILTFEGQNTRSNLFLSRFDPENEQLTATAQNNERRNIVNR